MDKRQENIIKTADLCERCRYSAQNTCDRYFDCGKCECYRDNACICLGIKPNTPCPFFSEFAQSIS